MDFKWQLISALVLNIALKFVTFGLTTALTRQLAPDENGINFAYQLYFNTVLFLARECVRNVNARQSLRGNKNQRSVVLQVLHCALLSIPLGLAVMAVLEFLPKVGISIFPSLAALARVGSAATISEAAGGAIELPEAILALSVVLCLFAEPIVALAQSLDYVRVLVAAEFWASLSRLVVSLAWIRVSGGLADPRLARLCFAAGMLAYAAAHVAYFARLSLSDAAVRDLFATAAPFRRIGSIGRGREEIAAISFVSVRAEASRVSSLLVPFFGESCLRLVLTEGERLALHALGTAAAMGRFDLVAGLGSLAARLVLRVWEAACFARWSRDAARGRPREAAALLRSMLRAATHVGAAAVLVGPPLAEGFLGTCFSQRWASPAAVRALQLYCGLLPLMAWNGLLDGFMRATATPRTLKLTQRLMVTQAMLYVCACFVVLRMKWFDDVVVGLILTNIASMTLRCLAALCVLLTRPIGEGSGEAAVRMRLWDFAAVCNPRIATVWAALFACTRWAMQSGLTMWVTPVAALVFAAAVAFWDSEVRVILLNLMRGSHRTLKDA